jgi:two-component system phosphate regulon sensor histidine kinase PhoR
MPAVRVIVDDPKAFALLAWKRTGWLAGFVGLAVMGTLWGSRQMLRALQRQAELSRQKNNFIASVSHELRTPLASLRVLSENLNAGRVGDTEMRASYFPLMVDECRRLGALVENVLEFARAEDGRSEFHFAETDIAAMTEDTVQLVRARAEQVGLQIEVDAPPLPEPASVDAMSLHRALLNLLDNAIKFTPAGGRITVTLRPAEPGWWTLMVRDTGPGIPCGEQERIFERFYRSGCELTRTVPGSGIGLSIVRHVAEGHGGRVSVGGAPGSGATFTLRLPCLPPQTRA